MTLLMLACLPTHAAGTDPAAQFAGLFMQSCLPFAGDATGLRDWAKRTGLAELTEPARTAFLHGAPGVAFDASNDGGKFVVIAAIAGPCSTLTNNANGPAVIGALESDLAQVAIKFRLLSERPDPQEQRLRYREYAAERGTRTWRIVAGTVRDRQGGQAMLTATLD